MFRGAPVPKRTRNARKEEEEQYDADCEVLWQAKAWIDIPTGLAWAAGPLKRFVEEEHAGESYLLLADNLKAQTCEKTGNKFALKCGETGARVKFGVKKGSHMWQPVDHHVGSRYGRQGYYDEYMLDPHSKVAPGRQRQYPG